MIKFLAKSILLLTTVSLVLILAMHLVGGGMPVYGLTYYAEGQGIGYVDVERRVSGWMVVGETIAGNWSPDGRLLAYLGYGSGQDAGQNGADIYILDVNSGEIRNITHSPAAYMPPLWSPDGRLLAYTTLLRSPNGRGYDDSKLQVIEVYSWKLLDSLKQDGGASAWSPDGRMLAFNSFDSINVLNVQTADLVPLLSRYGGQYSNVVWSPNGQWLAFQDSFSTNSINRYKLYVVDKQTGAIRQLVEDSMTSGYSWSPDSQHIAYLRLEEVMGSRREILYVADVEAGTTQLLTHHLGMDSLRAWSPDEQEVVVVSDRNGLLERNLYQVNIDTGEAQRLTPGNFYNITDVSWSPDGRWLTFGSTDAEGEMQIYLLDMQDYALTRLTDHGDNHYPRWQPW